MPTAPDSPELARPAKRGGRMSAHAAVEETAVWLEVNGRQAVTWMCTPDLLEELAVGWLHGEGYVDSASEVRLRPCATDLGFWADVPEAKADAVRAEARRPVLASGCGAVATFLADPATVAASPTRGEAPALERLRAAFKQLFARGERYKDTGGIHAAALIDGDALISHAEDIGRHNAVDKAIGAALIAERKVAGLGLLVTGRISAELAFKAARAGIAWVATPSVPSTLAVEIARRTGMVLVGRAVSGEPQVWESGRTGGRADGRTEGQADGRTDGQADS
ncbi:MAG TPA: formate dehydrogenase accessory sulfurtransferase FdhD [Gemmatimonadales bacterium]|nr:formate dehydrogenase accessory sulfurtransferase FdhD [Gemmatimonadales bacterium]